MASQRTWAAPVAAAIAAATLGVGCAGTPEPTFQIVKAEITQRTPSGVVITFGVEGHNPGDDALPVREVQYTLDLGGRRVFEGTRMGEVTLPRRGTQMVSLPTPVTFGPDVPPLVGDQPYRLAAVVTYVAPGALGEALFDIGVRRPEASFSRSGVLEFAADRAPD